MSTDSEQPSTAADAVVLDFLLRVTRDREAGIQRTVADYQAAYPGWESVIERELSGLAARNDVADAAGDRIGNYRILSRLGAGGYGVVHLAEDVRLGRRVALKVMPGFRLTGPDAIERFKREARAASRIEHPGVCTVYEADAIDGVPYIAMRFVDGAPLTELVRTSAGRLISAAEVLDRVRIVESVARALDAAHEAGLIHRDVKPGNVMLGRDGLPVLLDFGAAREIDGVTMTREGGVLGTLSYMSPEQLAGASLDRTTDVYSLGVTLYELVTGERPHRASTPEAMVAAIQQRPVRDPRALNAAVGRDLAAVIQKAVALSPKDRYPRAREFADDLLAVLDGRPTRAKAPGVLGRTLRWARRRPAVAALAALLLVGTPSAGLLLSSYLSDRPKARETEVRDRRMRLDREIERGFVALGSFGPKVAGAIFEAVLREDPASDEALVGLLLARHRSKADADVLAIVTAHEGLVGRVPAVHGILADALRALGRVPDAEREESLAAEADVALNCYLLGMREILRGEDGDLEAYRRAYEHFTRGITLARVPWPVIHFNRAEAAGRGGMLDAARDCAASLRTLWPDSAPANFYAGFGISFAGDPDAGRPYLARAVELDPKWPFARCAYGASLTLIDDRKGAKAQFQAALDTDPEDQTAIFSLGHLLADDGDARGAVALYRRGLLKDPGWVEKRLELAQLEKSLGERDAALKDVDQALADLAARPNPADSLRGELEQLRDDILTPDSRP